MFVTEAASSTGSVSFRLCVCVSSCGQLDHSRKESNHIWNSVCVCVSFCLNVSVPRNSGHGTW